jgi:hypothetical protein
VHTGVGGLLTHEGIAFGAPRRFGDTWQQAARSLMKKPSTTGAITERASRNAVGPMPPGCQARGTSYHLSEGGHGVRLHVLEPVRVHLERQAGFE